ncbi:MAG: hypothetical protein ACPGF7_09525 [Pontibacterium sp.]
MGQAVITGNLGEGQYTVEVVYDKSRLEQQITALLDRVAVTQQKIDELNASNTALQTQITALTAELDTLRSEALTLDGQELLDKYKEINVKNAELMNVNASVNLNNRQIGFFTLNQTAAQQRVDLLTPLKDTTRTETVWSADYNTEYGADSRLGLVWPASEPNGQPVLVPGGVDMQGAVYDPAVHGYLQKEAGNTPAGSFFNRAVMPLVQKSLKTHRTGTASNVTDADMTVTLDSVSSRYGGVDINISGVVSGVPIEYMDCDGAAFTDGDSVLVEFGGQDQTDPRVIGFVSEPQPCYEKLYLFRGSFDLPDVLTICETVNTDTFATTSTTHITSTGGYLWAAFSADYYEGHWYAIPQYLQGLNQHSIVIRDDDTSYNLGVNIGDMQIEGDHAYFIDYDTATQILRYDMPGFTNRTLMHTVPQTDPDIRYHNHIKDIHEGVLFYAQPTGGFNISLKTFDTQTRMVTVVDSITGEWLVVDANANGVVAMYAVRDTPVYTYYINVYTITEPGASYTRTENYTFPAVTDGQPVHCALTSSDVIVSVDFVEASSFESNIYTINRLNGCVTPDRIISSRVIYGLDVK